MNVVGYILKNEPYGLSLFISKQIPIPVITYIPYTISQVLTVMYCRSADRLVRILMVKTTTDPNSSLQGLIFILKGNDKNCTKFKRRP